MEKYEQMFKLSIATAGAFITWLVGGWDQSIYVLVLSMVFDYATGLMKAYKAKELSSNVGFNGITRKATMLLVLMFAVALDRSMDTGWIFRTMVCWFYIGNEGLSFLENVAYLDVPIPAKLKDALIQLKDGNKNS